MFVTRSKYEKVLLENRQLSAKVAELKESYYQETKSYNYLLKKWNDLVDKVNRAGGWKALENKPSTSSTQFSQEELKRLLMLCHPDKHDGKQMAVEITQKLNRLRN